MPAAVVWTRTGHEVLAHRIRGSCGSPVGRGPRQVRRQAGDRSLALELRNRTAGNLTFLLAANVVAAPFCSAAAYLQTGFE